MTRVFIAGAALAALVSFTGCAKPAAAPRTAKADTAKIANAIRADHAQLVTDFNAHDAARLTSHDASDVVAMAHGAPNVVGSAAELAMRQKGFATEPSQHVSVSDAVIDVAASGDMAVYRATYSFAGIDPKTRKPISESGNYLAGYRLQPDGSWKINWSVISDTAPAPAAAG